MSNNIDYNLEALADLLSSQIDNLITSTSFRDILMEEDDHDHTEELNRAIEESFWEVTEGLGFVPAAKSAVEALEKSWRYVGSKNKSKPTCVICMEEVKVGSRLTRMPCNHFFHGDCLLQWLERNHTCPLCRFRVVTDINPDEHAFKILYSSHDQIRQPFANLLTSAEESEYAVSCVLSQLQIPFSFDGIDLLWKEFLPYEPYFSPNPPETEPLHGGLNGVVTRLADVASRLGASAAASAHSLLIKVAVWIDKETIVTLDEFERLIFADDEEVDEEEEEEEDQDEDDPELDLAVEQSLLESVEQAAPVPPVDEAAVAALERLRYEGSSDDHHGDDESEVALTCVICLDEWMTGSQLIRMPCSRSHLFHEDCILQWLRMKNACPICRFSLPSTTNNI